MEGIIQGKEEGIHFQLWNLGQVQNLCCIVCSVAESIQGYSLADLCFALHTGQSVKAEEVLRAHFLLFPALGVSGILDEGEIHPSSFFSTCTQ